MSGWRFGTTGHRARGTAAITGYPFTLMICASAIGVSSNEYLWLLTDSASDNNYWAVRRQGSVDHLNFATAAGGGPSAAATTNTVTDGVPFHVVCIATSATLRKNILNGDLVNAGTTTDNLTPSSIDRVTFGEFDAATEDNDWDGDVFYAAMWNEALTDGEAVALAAGAWPASIRPAALRNFWPEFRDNGGGIVKDWCGRSPLTLTGGSLSTETARRMGPRGGNVASYRRGQVTSRMVAA